MSMNSDVFVRRCGDLSFTSWWSAFVCQCTAVSVSESVSSSESSGCALSRIVPEFMFVSGFG